MITQKLVGIIIVVLGVVGGGALIVKYEISPNSASSAVSMPVVNIPTPAYYEAHQDVLNVDNARCTQEGSNMPEKLCQNVNIANQWVSDHNYINSLNQASSSGK